MSPRTGRPRTGRKPTFIVRMNPNDTDAARQAAKAAGKQIGQWLEEAIREKMEGRPRMSKPSLRQIAKELEISPAYLSYMLNGKRP